MLNSSVFSFVMSVRNKKRKNNEMIYRVLILDKYEITVSHSGAGNIILNLLCLRESKKHPDKPFAIKISVRQIEIKIYWNANLRTLYMHDYGLKPKLKSVIEQATMLSPHGTLHNFQPIAILIVSL